MYYIAASRQKKIISLCSACSYWGFSMTAVLLSWRPLLFATLHTHIFLDSIIGLGFRFLHGVCLENTPGTSVGTTK